MENNQPSIPETNDLPPAVPGQEFQAPEVSTNIPPVENKSPEVPPTPKAKSKLIPVLLIILILVLLGIGGLFAYKNFFVKTPEPTPTPISTPESTPDPTADWKTYVNNYWKVSFKYPDSQLTPCPDYTTEKDGIRFWGPGFDCPDGHDIIYKLGLIGYAPGEYKEYKKPSKTELIIVDGKEAQKKTYVYDESDGPLFGLKQSVEVVISLPNGTLSITQEGKDINEQKLFDQILSTFKFTDQTSAPSLSTSYSIQIPTSWTGKYTKTSGNNCDTYDFKGLTLNSNIFSICRMAQQEWTNNQNLNSALKIDPTFKLSGSGDYVYYYKISMSNDYSGDEANLYQTFTGDIKDIVKTFKLK